MSKLHPFRLRRCHNPEGIDESKVPPGFRFRYEDEMNQPAKGVVRYDFWRGYPSISQSKGTLKHATYIVDVKKNHES